MLGSARRMTGGFPLRHPKTGGALSPGAGAAIKLSGEQLPPASRLRLALLPLNRNASVSCRGTGVGEGKGYRCQAISPPQGCQCLAGWCLDPQVGCPRAFSLSGTRARARIDPKGRAEQIHSVCARESPTSCLTFEGLNKEVSRKMEVVLSPVPGLDSSD